MNINLKASKRKKDIPDWNDEICGINRISLAVKFAHTNFRKKKSETPKIYPGFVRF